MTFESALKDSATWFSDTMSWLSNSGMDGQTLAVCGAVFIFSAMVVYLISVFGMRERTYEEAMEEQRKRNQEVLQQSKVERSRKDKRFKKWNRKTKEKSEDEKGANGDGDPAKISAEEGDSKSDGNASGAIVSQGKKKQKPKKSASIEKDGELSQPISSSEETDEAISLGNSPVSKTFEEQQKSFLGDKIAEVKDDVKNKISESIATNKDVLLEKLDNIEKPVRKSPVKKNKKHKPSVGEFGCSEFKDECENRILSAIKSTSLSEIEVRHILDALNAKQNNNEKKKNELANLKKIIQEKEEALRTEQKSHQSTSDRVGDLLQELADEKAHASTTEKSLRDTLNQGQQEIKALHGMLQRKRDQFSSELATVQSKMQQMKNKMKEEHAVVMQRLQDENNQLQTVNRMEIEKQQRSTIELSRLQHEIEQLRSGREKYESHQVALQQSQEELHCQTQQLEKHIEQLQRSHQEEEYSYKQRINEMSNKMQQTENARSSLVQDLQNAQSMCSSLEADNASLRQRLDDAKHQLKSSEQELLQLQSRLEESNKQQRDLGSCLENMRDEVSNLSSFKRDQLQIIQSLKQENEALVTQVKQQLSEQSGKKNENLFDKSKLIQIEEHEAMVKEKEGRLHLVLQDLEQCKCEIKSLAKELESQVERNKELTEEKHKLSGHLQSSEHHLKEALLSSEQKLKEAQTRMDTNSKDMQNTLNKQIREVEKKLQEGFAKELQIAQQEAETAKKEADEKLSNSVAEANIRLEEFQESLYARLNELNQEADEKVKQAVEESEKIKNELKNFNSCIKSFLQNIFPSLLVPENTNNSMFWSEYESQVQTFLKSLKETKPHDGKDVENLLKKLQVATEEKTSLELQLNTSKSFLTETEGTLKTLQNKIENEESRWKSEIECKEEALKKIYVKNEKLESENKNLKLNLDQLQGLSDGLYEIEELRIKLQKEENEKRILLEKINNIQSSDANSNSTMSTVGNDLFDMPESSLLPNKSEKKKKSKKKGSSGKK